MVDPDSPSSSPSPLAFQQTTTGLIETGNEETGNDEPPPIPQPPAAHASDARANHHGTSRPELTAGGLPRPSNSNSDSNSLNPIADTRLGGSTATPAGDVKVHDYGQSPKAIDGSRKPPFSGTESPTLRRHNSSGSDSTNSSVTSAGSTPVRAMSTSSTANSSITAIGGDVVLDMPVLVFDGKNAHTVDPKTIAAVLNVNVEQGLSSHAANERLVTDGPNQLTSDGGLRWYSVLGRQVSNSLTLVRSTPAVSFRSYISSGLSRFGTPFLRCVYSPSRRAD